MRTWFSNSGIIIYNVFLSPNRLYLGQKLTLTLSLARATEGISSSMNFDEEEDDEDEVSSSSSQLNSNTRPGSATSKKSCKVNLSSP